MRLIPPGAARGAGAWLTLAVSGLDALRTLDLHHEVMARGFPSKRIQLRNATGALLAEVLIGGTLADGTVTRTLKRADLYELVAFEAQRRGIVFEHGKCLVGASIRGTDASRRVSPTGAPRRATSSSAPTASIR